MKYEERDVGYLNSKKTKNVLPQGVGKTAHCGKTVPRCVLPHTFPGLTLAVYVVAYTVECHIYRNAIVDGQGKHKAHLIVFKHIGRSA